MAVTDEEKIDRNVSWEIARLKTFDPPIRPDTVAYEVDEKGRAYISFEMETDVLLETEATPIQDVEPIILRYSSEGAIGRRAPSVFSGRPDFPCLISTLLRMRSRHGYAWRDPACSRSITPTASQALSCALYIGLTMPKLGN